MRPRRIARAARALALVCALACLGVARGDLDASDPETRAPPSRAPQPEPPSPPFPTEADAAFAAWLASKGGAFTGAGVWSHVETGRSSGDAATVTVENRGVFAKDAAVENGDVVFEANLDAALMVPSERAGPILNKVALTVDPEWALALLLLRESSLGASGPYAPFLRMALADESSYVSSDDDDAVPTEASESAPFRATALTDDAVRALNGTFAGAYHDAMTRKDDATFLRVRAMTVGTFPAAFPERLFGRRANVARALAAVRARGARFPVARVRDQDPSGRDDEAYEEERFQTAAALVPVAHALPHDARGAEPCVAVRNADEKKNADDFSAATQPRLVVRVAAGALGEELRCHRGAAVAVPETPGTGRGLGFTTHSGDTDRPRSGSASPRRASRARESFRFASATATGALTDAEAAFRFGGVGVGRNARDAVALTLADPPKKSVAGADDGSRLRTSRASLLARCGPESARALTRDGPSDALRCAVRVATADDVEVTALARRLAEEDASAAAATLRAPVSDAAEARALAALLETTAAILDGYPTSDARDEALLREGERALSHESDEDEDEEAEEDEEDEDAPASTRLADDVAEAVRCRLREKRLLLDALNSLRREASVTLPATVRLDVVAGDGASARVAAADAAKSPPGGFEVKKAAYEKEL